MIITLCVKCVTLCGYKMFYIMRKSHYVMHKLLRYAKNVLRYAAIITLCLVITLCGVTYAPQLERARQRRRPFLAFNLLWRLSRCFCTSATGRESHQGRLGCYCSEEVHRSQLHRAVDVCPCYLGGMLSSWS